MDDDERGEVRSGYRNDQESEGGPYTDGHDKGDGPYEGTSMCVRTGRECGGSSDDWMVKSHSRWNNEGLRDRGWD